MAVLPRRSPAWIVRGEGSRAVLFDVSTGTTHPGTADAARLIDLCDGHTSVNEAAVRLDSSPIFVELTLHTLADLGALTFGSPALAG